MCGIVGIAPFDAEGQPDQHLLRCMCEAIRHRGPDEGGGVIDDGIGMAMRRLAIIDVEQGSQPIFNEAGTVAAIFNGEIYNFRELRDRLTSLGHRFKTKTDTEVIVHLYEEYGPGYVKHVHGMFAIAVWDFVSRELILSRDRLGVKPIYYSTHGDRLTFASEIKAILQDPSFDRSPAMLGIHQMLTLGHMLAPTTCFEGIFELPPACSLHLRSGNIEVENY